MQHKHNLPTLEEIKIKRPVLRNSLKDSKSELSPLDRFALHISRHVGSMSFFIVLTVWTVGWLIWNLLGPVEYRFDPAPGFVIWLFVSNLIQLVLLPLLMVSQNIESKIADQRAEADFKINERSEREIEVIIAHLENHNEVLTEILKKVGGN